MDKCSVCQTQLHCDSEDIVQTQLFTGIDSFYHDMESVVYCQSCYKSFCKTNEMAMCDMCDVTDKISNLQIGYDDGGDESYWHHLCPSNRCDICSEIIIGSNSDNNKDNDDDNHHDQSHRTTYWHVYRGERYCHRSCLDKKYKLCLVCRRGEVMRCILCEMEGVKSDSCTNPKCEHHMGKLRDCTSTGESTGIVFYGLFCHLHCNKVFQCVEKVCART